MRRFNTFLILGLLVCPVSLSALANPRLQEAHKEIGEQLTFRIGALQTDLQRLVEYVARKEASYDELDWGLKQFRLSYPSYVGVFCTRGEQSLSDQSQYFPSEAAAKLGQLTGVEGPADGSLGLVHLQDTPRGTWVMLVMKRQMDSDPVLVGATLHIQHMLADVIKETEVPLQGSSLSTVDRKGRLIHATLGENEKSTRGEQDRFLLDKTNFRIIQRSSYNRSVKAAGTQWMLGLYYGAEPVEGEVLPLTGRWMGAYTSEKVGDAEEGVTESQGGKFQALSLQEGSELTLYLKGDHFDGDFRGITAGNDLAVWEVNPTNPNQPAVVTATFDPIRKALKGSITARRDQMLEKKSFYLLRATP